VEIYDRLLKATQLSSDDAAVVIDARWEPVGGSVTRIYPPTFPLDAADPTRQRPYIVEPRLVDGERVETVVLDQVPSQANRIEEVVGHAVRTGRLGLAHLMLEHELSNGRTVRVPSFTAPHRYADAYWRDSMVDGVMFDKSGIGQRLRAATADDCTALYEREPFSLLFGSWDSHRKGRTARFPGSIAARSLASPRSSAGAPLAGWTHTTWSAPCRTPRRPPTAVVDGITSCPRNAP
jgi:CRISPR-associated protein Csb1